MRRIAGVALVAAHAVILPKLYDLAVFVRETTRARPVSAAR